MKNSDKERLKQELERLKDTELEKVEIIADPARAFVEGYKAGRIYERINRND